MFIYQEGTECFVVVVDFGNGDVVVKGKTFKLLPEDLQQVLFVADG